MELAIEPYENNAYSMGIVLFIVLVIPVLAGTFASIALWKHKLGRVTVRRVLANDTGLPIWKLVAKASGRPVQDCKISYGNKELLWEGINSKILDMGQGGMGVAVVSFPVEQNAIVKVKSGWFSIFRSRFANLEEIRPSMIS